MTRQEMKARAKQQLGGSIFGNEWMMALAVLLVEGAILGAAASITSGIGTLILAGALGVGVAIAFLGQMRTGAIRFENMFDGFKNDFGGNLLLGLMMGIFEFLWSLLFVIPGIVKSYSYAMSYYIKADNPDYGWNDCIQASMELMDGHKWELFVLDLSFIGWYIVGGLCFGIGTLWVAPYHMATRTQFYESIKHQPQMIDA